MIYPTKGRGIYVTEQLHKSFSFDINGEGLYIWTPIKNGQEPINYDNIEYMIGLKSFIEDDIDRENIYSKIYYLVMILIE